MEMILDPRFDENLFILNFATRLLTMVSDRGLLLHSALETVADFASAPRAAIYRRVPGPKEAMLLEGYYCAGRCHEPAETLMISGSPLERILQSKACTSLPATADSPFPFPAADGTARASGADCFCLPVVGVKRAADRVICIEFPSGGIPFETCQHLHILGTVLAVSLENSALFELALVDGLTGTYVRSYFDLRLREELDRLKRKPGVLCIVLIDLDHFKDINDSFGHKAGDEVLHRFAQLCKGNFRRGHDVVCRYGGDEFLVLLPDTTLADARQALRRLEKAADTMSCAEIAPNMKPVGFSAGIVETGGMDVTPEELFVEVDALLYEGKRGGRGQVRRRSLCPAAGKGRSS